MRRYYKFPSFAANHHALSLSACSYIAQFLAAPSGHRSLIPKISKYYKRIDVSARPRSDWVTWPTDATFTSASPSGLNQNQSVNQTFHSAAWSQAIFHYVLSLFPFYMSSISILIICNLLLSEYFNFVTSFSGPVFLTCFHSIFLSVTFQVYTQRNRKSVYFDHLFFGQHNSD